MEDNSTKRAASVGMQDEPDIQKKCRGSFFSAEVESQIAAFNQQLFAQINDSVEISKKENSEVLSLLDEHPINNSEFYSDEENNNLGSFVEKIKFLADFSGILKRVKPFCDFVEANILLFMRQALAKIRTACGCDLKNYETWKSAEFYTKTISDLVDKLETARYDLREKRDDFYNHMQLFIETYQSAKEEERIDFISKLTDHHPERKTWIQPWVDIAEKRKVSYEGALIESQKVLPEQQSFILRQGIVGL